MVFKGRGLNYANLYFTCHNSVFNKKKMAKGCVLTSKGRN